MQLVALIKGEAGEDVILVRQCVGEELSNRGKSRTHADTHLGC